MTKSIALTEIRIDGGTQPRVVIDEEAVGRYAEKIAGGKLLPPVDVFFDGVDHWLADGFHRYHAGQKLGHQAITAIVHTGTKRDAVLFSVGANDGHGIQRTNADKRKSVMTLLNDAEWTTWSDSEIARRCGVDHKTVAACRPLGNLPSDKTATPRTYTTKHGTEATMKTGNIGKGKLLMPDRSKAASAKRREAMRTMAAEGYSSRQIASKLEITEEGCRETMRREGIDVPADRVTRSLKHDANRIVEHMVMDAENLTADVNLIEFSALDRDRLGAWADSLMASKKALDSFIRRLIKEQQKHGEAA